MFSGITGLSINYFNFIIDILTVFEKVRPKSIDDLKKCIEMLLAPEL